MKYYFRYCSQTTFSNPEMKLSIKTQPDYKHKNSISIEQDRETKKATQKQLDKIK
jgi:hypothetical protein